MDSLKIYTSFSATGNAVSQVVIPGRTKIRAVQWAWLFNSVTDNAEVSIELSRASATEIGVNGAQQTISEVRWCGNFATSGLAQGGVNLWVPVDVMVTQGQIIYLHALVAGTVTATGGCILWY